MTEQHLFRGPYTHRELARRALVMAIVVAIVLGPSVACVAIVLTGHLGPGP